MEERYVLRIQIILNTCKKQHKSNTGFWRGPLNVVWMKTINVGLLFSSTVSSCPSIHCTCIYNNVMVVSLEMKKWKWDFDGCWLPPTPHPPKKNKNKKKLANNLVHGCRMDYGFDLNFSFVLGWQVPGGLSVCFRRSCFKNSSICRLIMNADFACVCDLQGLPYVKQAINSLWKCIVVWSR